MSLDLALGALVTAGLLAYLTFALVRPERCLFLPMRTGRRAGAVLANPDEVVNLG